MIFNETSYYGHEGCCLTCVDPENRRGWNGIIGVGCLCFDCKCTRCSHYVKNEYGNGGYCDIAKKSKRLSMFSYEINEILLETDKAYFATVKIGDKISDGIWIPKKMIKGGKVKNWILFKNKLIK